MLTPEQERFLKECPDEVADADSSKPIKSIQEEMGYTADELPIPAQPISPPIPLTPPYTPPSDIEPVECHCGSPRRGMMGNPDGGRYAIRCFGCSYQSKPQSRDTWAISRWNHEQEKLKAEKAAKNG